jgi:DNA polymerase I-like protein with 3'-5' exonuclease and polymerase domains
MQRKLELLEAKAYELAGSEFALNSPQQLRAVGCLY